MFTIIDRVTVIPSNLENDKNELCIKKKLSNRSTSIHIFPPFSFDQQGSLVLGDNYKGRMCTTET